MLRGGGWTAATTVEVVLLQFSSNNKKPMGDSRQTEQKKRLNNNWLRIKFPAILPTHPSTHLALFLKSNFSAPPLLRVLLHSH